MISVVHLRYTCKDTKKMLPLDPGKSQLIDLCLCCLTEINVLILHCQRGTAAVRVCLRLRVREKLSARPCMESTCLSENSVAEMQFCVSTNVIIGAAFKSVFPSLGLTISF